MTAVGQHATLERVPACNYAKIGSFLLISAANLDTKIISFSIKWQPSMQINNWVSLWQIEQNQPFAYFFYRYRKCQSKRSLLHDFYWILIKEDLVFIIQGNGLEEKEKCKCCVQGNRGSEVNQKGTSQQQVNFSSLLGALMHRPLLLHFPGSCCLPRLRVWWNMHPFCMNKQHPCIALSISCGHRDDRALCSHLVQCRREELLGIIFGGKIWGNPSLQQQHVHHYDLRRT